MSGSARVVPVLPSAAQWQRWRIEPHWSRTLEVAGHDGATYRWHVLDTGEPADTQATADAERTPTIVCVHGNPTWAALWRNVLHRLGAHHRVIAVDQLGMGYSAHPGLRRYTQRVDDLGDVIDALQIAGPIVVVGHDWGGAVAMGWAVSPRAAGRLAGMVLCNTGIAVPQRRSAPRLIRIAAAGPVTALVGRRTRTFVEGTFVLSATRLDTATRAALRAPYRKAASRAAIAEFVDDIPFSPAHPSAATLDAVATALPSLDVPVLLVWGAADPVFNDDFAHDLAARMPHADLHRFARSGHLSPVEHTADVAGAIHTWLTERLGERAPGHDAPNPPAAVDSAVDSGAAPGADGHHLAYTPAWAALVARADDARLAYADGATGATISFAELHSRVMGIARGLTELGVRPGDRVALLTPPGPDLVAAVYGCWRAGAVTVIADRGLGLRGLGGAVRAARVQWVIGPRQALAAARALRWAPGARLVAVGPRAVMGAECTLHQLAASIAPLPPEPSAHHPAAVLYTSGATGPAKGVRYRHGQLAAQRDALARAYGITDTDRLVAAFAPFALYGPALGITSCIPDVDVTTPGSLTADALAAACRSIDATIMFASPAALANVVRTAPPTDQRLSALRLVLSAGAPVPIATLRSMASLCPHAELHTPYGMTECLPVADVDLATLEQVGAGRGVCVGRPVHLATVAIAPLGFDATAAVHTLPTGATGEVLVRAPWLSEGYDQLWRTQRDARPNDAVDGAVWHRSGDVGHLDADGRLWVEGRSVHVVHTEHGPVTPVPLEVAVEALPGIERCAAVGVGPHGCQRVVIVLERPDGTAGLADADDATQVRAAVAQPVAAVLQVPALPVDIRHNTKIDRTALAAWATAVLAGDRAKAPR